MSSPIGNFRGSRSWRRLVASGALIIILLMSVLACSATGSSSDSTPASSAPVAGAAASAPDTQANGSTSANSTSAGSQEKQLTATPTPTRRSKATAAPTPTRRAIATPTRRPSPTPTRNSRQTVDGLPVIHLDELPPEGIVTLRLIGRGGPFPYSKDGATFQNREGLLPRRPNGYYAEYTVITPGENDRGARRIIAGDGGEFYYTGDHYDSFKRIVK